MLSSTRPSRLTHRRIVLPLLVLAAALNAGCGSSAPQRPLAERVCHGAARAATRALGRPVTATIASRDPGDLQCRLSGSGIHVAVVSQATGQAYMEFDTETSHQDQVYGSGLRQLAQIPSQIEVRGAVVAVWIRAQQMVVATSGSPAHLAGAYVTITVRGSAARGTTALALGRTIADAVFAQHPGAAA